MSCFIGDGNAWGRHKDGYRGQSKKTSDDSDSQYCGDNGDDGDDDRDFHGDDYDSGDEGGDDGGSEYDGDYDDGDDRTMRPFCMAVMVCPAPTQHLFTPLSCSLTTPTRKEPCRKIQQ